MVPYVQEPNAVLLGATIVPPPLLRKFQNVVYAAAGKPLDPSPPLVNTRDPNPTLIFEYKVPNGANR